MRMSAIDIIILLFLTYFAFKGFRNGFIKEIGNVLSLFVAFVLSTKGYIFFDFLNQYIENEHLKDAIAYLASFVCIVLILQIFIRAVDKLVSFIDFGSLNKSLGLLFGVIKGIMFFCLIIFIFESVPIGMDNNNSIHEDWKRNSTLYSYCNEIKKILIGYTENKIK